MSSLEAILLLGAGGHARACIDVIEQEGRFQVAGLVGLPEEVGREVLGYPVLGSDDDLPALLGQYSAGIVVIGQIKTPVPRMVQFAHLRARGLCVPVMVSPRAYVSRHARVGDGSFVLHGAVINASASVGENCIVNSLSLIEHDVLVDDHCHIATGARINSGVRIGEGSFIGSGSLIRQGVVIGRNCIIGMGQVVLKDCPDGTQLPQRRIS
ncbi:MAG: acetyltransferase [Azoarcus sp.]|jgi:sugar O-acyltransferase (sialic acid O-acetyltransferase NeuD family)|uniref:Acetyltransferase n=1 Tax=Parazoarcus communis TaxID=41977 RepID=A0A2U8GU09_9RHOO|nr:acetyltransferase [Parazoarcus communis]AWI77207.1 acetyltransferase [Parazoarcus communis]PLX72139.1 MAG: acetyltransferase [Azoarcus sp.]